MMARLTCSRSGWGTVRDPETGERIPVDADGLPLEQAERLAERYDPLGFEKETSDRLPASEAEDGPLGDSSDVDPTCAGNDGDCSRGVGVPGEYCWQHSED